MALKMQHELISRAKSSIKLGLFASHGYLPYSIQCLILFIDEKSLFQLKAK